MHRPHPRTARVFAVASLTAAALLGATACKGRDADMIPPPAATLTAPTPPPAPAPAPAPTPAPPPEPALGFHPTQGGAALALAVGMPRADAEAAIKQVVGAGRARVVSNRRETKSNQGTSADVHTYELAFSPGQAVASLTLTLFSDTLVAVTTTYRDPDPARLTDLTAAHGPPQASEFWHGWWLPADDIILQLTTDTLSQEVFSLAAARPIVPGVGALMQKSWLARYSQPPPWVRLPPP